MEIAESGYTWAALGSTLASAIFLWSTVKAHLPSELEEYASWLLGKLMGSFKPFVTITIPQHTREHFGRSEVYPAIEAYVHESCGSRARALRAEITTGSNEMNFTIDDYEEVVDHFRGAKIWWYKWKILPCTNVLSMHPGDAEQLMYRLTFHKRHRALVEETYLPHVLAEGRAVMSRNRERRLYTNSAGDDDWTYVKLEHPSTFDTLGMDPVKKQEIIDDLKMFRDGKEYYVSIGKAWKRGYLLYGPPGTGKSSMIAAMANFLNYDVYDLELTSVTTNTELRSLFINTEDKSIIVIEDIDCSIDLTRKRKDKKDKGKKKKHWSGEDEKKDSKVTLSGLLNFIDGLWSACGGERIIVFTTNHVDKLDQALIRRGRMDMHIEMSYCNFEAFKVLAKNYLGTEDHELFDEVRRMLEEVNVSPADVAENLMRESRTKDPAKSLRRLVEALKLAKEEALAKALEGKEEDEDESSDEEDDAGEEEDNDHGEEDEASEEEDGDDEEEDEKED